MAYSKVPAAILGVAAALGISAADPPAGETLIGQGNAAFARQEYAEALQYYERAERIVFDPGLVSFNQAAALFRFGQFREATECYRRCLEDDSATSARRARANFDLGNALMRQPANDPAWLAEAARSYRACLQEADLAADLRTDARYNLEMAQLLWLKAKAERKTPDLAGEPETPSTSPNWKEMLEEKDPERADSVYQPSGLSKVSPRKNVGDSAAGQETNSLKGGTVRVLPDEEPIRPLTPQDALKTLEKLARDIGTQRRRQRNPPGPTTLSTKDW